MSSPYVLDSQYGGTNSLTGVDFINSLATWLATVGWTVDYNSGSGRIHFHKDTVHMEMWSSAVVSTNVYAAICTGYAAGQTSANQPGYSVSQNNYMYFAVGGSVYPSYLRFVSTPHAVFIFSLATYSGNQYQASLAFGRINTKLGTWGGGEFLSCGYLSPFSSHLNYTNFVVRYNESWTPLVVAGGVNMQTDVCISLSSKMPILYSGGIIPIPQLVFKHDVSSTNLLHPIGYCPDFYLVGGGDAYLSGDIVTISGTDYLFTNGYSSEGKYNPNYNIPPYNIPNLAIAIGG